MKKEKRVIVVKGPLARVYERKWTFLALFLGIFFVSHTVFILTGSTSSVPEQTRDTAPSRSSDEGPRIALPEGEGELPLRIEIPSIGIRASVANPVRSDIATLDNALLGGAVRYPGSGMPGEEGNVLIFGHSSQLPVVYNQAYKAFNDIQNLETGDPIILYGEGKRYIYEVEEVKEANASTDAIPLAIEGAHLTLATCNNFGTKEDRFIVSARLTRIEMLSE